MKLFFTTNEKQLLKGVSIAGNFLEYLKSSGMYFRYPFAPNTPPAKIIQQIKIDYEQFSLASAKTELEKKWDSEQKRILINLDKFLKTEGVSLSDEYYCVVSVYGPYGFYETPNTIFLNVAEMNAKGVEFVFDTILHELLHLLFDDKIKDFSPEKKEEFVDNAFAKIFGQYH